MASGKRTTFAIPSIEEKENWVHKPTEVGKKLAVETNKESIKKLTIDLSRSAHMAFKIIALKQNKTMRDIGKEIIEAFLAKQ